MRAQIVKIGNSQGIRIPKPLLDQTGIHGDVELVIDDNKIIIRAVANRRDGWDQAFKSMSENGDDVLIDNTDSISNEWDKDEWKW
ncbi:MAG: AbrB/MazE/SpoVT family DNA-binding domain-containing protein [Desulfobacterales bacterium]|nr:AbrB/MazE/SpoVT family DNA-binding domain-containing protein [Desulfobacterales bacterium]